MLRPDGNVPNKWVYETINIPNTYIKCPICNFSLNITKLGQGIPYFCGGCGADMRGEEEYRIAKQETEDGGKE